MTEGDFQQLLQAMPKIAEAVKEFPDGLKERAFDALVSTFKGVPNARTARTEVVPAGQDMPVSEDLSESTGPAVGEPSANGSRLPKAKKTASPRKPGRRAWAPVRDIDFRPAGRQAFRDLVAAKEPKTNNEKNLLAVYWLEHVHALTDITVGHVLAAYKECGWREPSPPDSSLRVTASREGWIDTSNTKALKTTVRGRNTVEHDMPLQQKAINK